MTSKQHDLTEWQPEPSLMRTTAEREAVRHALSTSIMVQRIEDNPSLRQEIIARPNDDDPRHAYAAWFRGQPQPMAQEFAGFIDSQLRVAAAYRADPKAEVSTLRNWSDTYVSVAAFRAAVHLRRWLLEDLRMLLVDGLIGWPQFYRGAVERVAMRARRFLEFGEEVFSLAPVRHLVLTEVPSVVGELARSPLLARVRSLSFPANQPRDVLSDEHLATLMESPHLSGLTYMRFVQQRGLTERSYEQIATARTLPQLSCIEVFKTAQWSDDRQEPYAPIGRRDRLFTRDTTRNVRRAHEWVAGVERRAGYMPCFHPELHYRPEYVDLESVTEHPIACDPLIMAERGRRLFEPAATAASSQP
jgi:uncharacterized protein (TIGR02996 family)